MNYIMSFGCIISIILCIIGLSTSTSYHPIYNTNSKRGTIFMIAGTAVFILSIFIGIAGGIITVE